MLGPIGFSPLAGWGAPDEDFPGSLSINRACQHLGSWTKQGGKQNIDRTCGLRVWVSRCLCWTAKGSMVFFGSDAIVDTSCAKILLFAKAFQLDHVHIWKYSLASARMGVSVVPALDFREHGLGGTTRLLFSLSYSSYLQSSFHPEIWRPPEHAALNVSRPRFWKAFQAEICIAIMNNFYMAQRRNSHILSHVALFPLFLLPSFNHPRLPHQSSSWCRLMLHVSDVSASWRFSSWGRKVLHFILASLRRNEAQASGLWTPKATLKAELVRQLTACAW